MKTSVKSWDFKFSKFFEGCSFLFLSSLIPFPCFLLSSPLALLPFLLLSSSFPFLPSLPFLGAQLIVWPWHENDLQFGYICSSSWLLYYIQFILHNRRRCHIHCDHDCKSLANVGVFWKAQSIKRYTRKGSSKLPGPSQRVTLFFATGVEANHQSPPSSFPFLSSPLLFPSFSLLLPFLSFPFHSSSGPFRFFFFSFPLPFFLLSSPI